MSPLERQVDRLADRGVDVGDRAEAAALLEAIGYYRLTGYLYPFRKSESYLDEEERPRIRVLSGYQPGTTLQHAAAIINFDRQLRMLVMDGVERIEVASAFALERLQDDDEQQRADGDERQPDPPHRAPA